MPKAGDEQGFSLVELIFIIILIGIMSAVSVTRYINLSDEAKTAVCKTHQMMLESAQTIYFTDQIIKNSRTIHYATDLDDLAPFISDNLIPTCPSGFHYEIQPEGKIRCPNPDHRRHF
jgi:type II secretory pathway pseudopilin PulG